LLLPIPSLQLFIVVSIVTAISLPTNLRRAELAQPEAGDAGAESRHRPHMNVPFSGGGMPRLHIY
jgi:hypothetical protein